jgi:hypothetical protein
MDAWIRVDDGHCTWAGDGIEWLGRQREKVEGGHRVVQDLDSRLSLREKEFDSGANNDTRCSVVPHRRREHYGKTALIDPRLGPDDPKGVQYISKGDIHCDPWAFSENHFLVANKTAMKLMNGQGETEVLYQLPEELAKEQQFPVARKTPGKWGG